MEREDIKRKIDGWLTALIFIYLVLGICVFGISTYDNYYDKLRTNLVAFVLLATSIVATAFFFVRVYIDNQLSIKEKEMGKEFRQDVESIVDSFAKKQDARFDQQDAKFAEQDARFDQKFAQQKAELTSLLNELVTTGKITVNKQG